MGGGVPENTTWQRLGDTGKETERSACAEVRFVKYLGFLETASGHNSQGTVPVCSLKVCQQIHNVLERTEVAGKD